MVNSADSESQLPAAAKSEPDPGPAYIRAEFTSGGRKAKSIVLHLYSGRAADCAQRHGHPVGDGSCGLTARHPAAGGRGMTVSRTPYRGGTPAPFADPAGTPGKPG